LSCADNTTDQCVVTKADGRGGSVPVKPVSDEALFVEVLTSASVAARCGKTSLHPLSGDQNYIVGLSTTERRLTGFQPSFTGRITSRIVALPAANQPLGGSTVRVAMAQNTRCADKCSTQCFMVLIWFAWFSLSSPPVLRGRLRVLKLHRAASNQAI
jgi:hypothetical protein